jgi:serine protease Do
LSLRAAPEGVAIIEVASASDAAEKGLNKDSVILEVGGRPLSTPEQVNEGYEDAKKKGRHAFLLQVRADGQTRFVALSIGTR